MDRRAVSSVMASVIFIAFTIVVAGGLYYYLSHMEKTSSLPSVDFSLSASPDGNSAFLQVLSVSQPIRWANLKIIAEEGGNELEVNKPNGSVEAGQEVLIKTSPGGLLFVKVIYSPSSSLIWQGEVAIPKGKITVPLKFEVFASGEQLELKVLSVNGNYYWNETLCAVFFYYTLPEGLRLVEVSPASLNSSMTGKITPGQTFSIFGGLLTIETLYVFIDPYNFQVLGEYLYVPPSSYSSSSLYYLIPSSYLNGLKIYSSPVKTPSASISASGSYSSTTSSYELSITFTSLSSTLDPLNFVPIVFFTPSSSSGGTVVDPLIYARHIYSGNVTSGATISYTLTASSGGTGKVYLLYIPTSQVFASASFTLPASSSSGSVAA